MDNPKKNINTELLKRNKFLDKKMDDNKNILTDIYIITNTITTKQYVGQANSHRLNCGVYKPFGYKKRFTDHTSEALCNTKKKQCSFLNNSIRKYGTDKFIVELIERCLPENADSREEYWITEYKTLFPNGYNLTSGGRKCVSTEHSRKKIMNATIEQFREAKLAKYKDVVFDASDPEKYIHKYNSYGETYYCVIINGIKSIFVGKYMTEEELKNQALMFVIELGKIQSLRHDQIAGTSLEL